MRDRELYARILGVEAPWRVVEVELSDDQVEVIVEHSGKGLQCPTCQGNRILAGGGSQHFHPDLVAQTGLVPQPGDAAGETLD